MVPMSGVVLVLAVSPSRQAVLLTGVILAALVATSVVLGHSPEGDPGGPASADAHPEERSSLGSRRLQ